MIKIKAISFLLDLIFPKRCIYCGAVIGFCEDCDRCKDKVFESRLKEDKSILRNISLKYLNAVTACYEYEFPITSGIKRLKFQGERQLAELYAAEMAEKVVEQFRDIDFDLVIPVAATHKQVEERGYNIPQIMSAFISKRLEIPTKDDILIKTRETEKQHNLTAEQRKNNLKGVFSVTQKDFIKGKTILLVDDIVTTGMTLDESAKPLCKAGADGVYSICFATSEYNF